MCIITAKIEMMHMFGFVVQFNEVESHTRAQQEGIRWIDWQWGAAEQTDNCGRKSLVITHSGDPSACMVRCDIFINCVNNTRKGGGRPYVWTVFTPVERIFRRRSCHEGRGTRA